VRREPGSKEKKYPPPKKKKERRELWEKERNVLEGLLYKIGGRNAAPNVGDDAQAKRGKINTREEWKFLAQGGGQARSF